MPKFVCDMTHSFESIKWNQRFVHKKSRNNKEIKKNGQEESKSLIRMTVFASDMPLLVCEYGALPHDTSFENKIIRINDIVKCTYK